VQKVHSPSFPPQRRGSRARLASILNRYRDLQLDLRTKSQPPEVYSQVYEVLIDLLPLCRSTCCAIDLCADDLFHMSPLPCQAIPGPPERNSLSNELHQTCPRQRKYWQSNMMQPCTGVCTMVSGVGDLLYRKVVRHIVLSARNLVQSGSCTVW